MHRPDPVVGWRLWRMRGDQLISLVMSYEWTPGENVSECRTIEGRPCVAPPGPDCRCGFWALRSPKECSRMARVDSRGETVMGLIAAWGTVAYHGDEGFRAEQAAVRCLFTDDVVGTDWLSKLSASISRRFRREPPELARERATARERQLEAIAETYRVPVLSLQVAADFGVLGEFGVADRQLNEVRALARLA